MFEKLLSFIGHAHPALVHIPIGSLILTFILYRINGRGNRRNMRHAVNVGLFISTIAAVVAIICGLLLARQGGYDDGTLGWHKYLGILVGFLSLILWYTHQDIYKRDQSLTSSMFNSLFNLCMIALVVGGHLGGTLTHGKGYLFKTESSQVNATNSKPTMARLTSGSDQKVFAEIIQPLLKDKCTSCHNPDKKKGDLILVNFEGLLAGGKHGPIVAFGQPDSSALYANIMKPLDDDTHMPPDGKRQLNETEKKLLAWWIKNYKSVDDEVNDYPPFEGQLLSSTEDQSISAFEFDVSGIAPANEKAVGQLQNKGFKIYGLAQNNPMLDVAYSFKKELDKKSINLLQKINQQIYTLDFSNSNLDDALFESIDPMPHLVSLNLNNTAITDKSLNQLNRFPNLKKLNLYQTKITDAAIPALKELPNLKSVYIWQTNISESGLSQIKSAKPELEIVSGIRTDTLVKLKLPKPSIRTDTDLFYDSIRVEFASFFKDAQLRYTLDGSIPGPTSDLYMEPLFIRQPVDIKLIAYKEGWESSDTASRSISSAGFKVKEISLVKDPPKRYQAEGPETLFDLNRGSEPGDGKWLAYQKDDFVARITLEKAQTVSRVKVGTVQSAGIWAFYPREIEVQTSTDGISFKQIKRTNYPQPKKDEPGGLRIVEVNFTPVQTSFIKVILKNLGKNPSWHKEKGKPSWVFCDEISVE